MSDAIDERPDDGAGLSTGEVARRTGHAPSTLRYWETLGLLPEPPRTGGKRRYPPAVIDHIAVIDLGRSAGLTLAEIGQLVDGVAAGGTPGGQWDSFLGQKLAEVDDVVAQAQARRRLLQQLARCECVTLESCATLLSSGRCEGGECRCLQPTMDGEASPR